MCVCVCVCVGECVCEGVCVCVLAGCVCVSGGVWCVCVCGGGVRGSEFNGARGKREEGGGESWGESHFSVLTPPLTPSP